MTNEENLADAVKCLLHAVENFDATNHTWVVWYAKDVKDTAAAFNNPEAYEAAQDVLDMVALGLELKDELRKQEQLLAGYKYASYEDYCDAHGFSY